MFSATLLAWLAPPVTPQRAEKIADTYVDAVEKLNRDQVGAEEIGAAINWLDEKDRRLRINYVRDYSITEPQDGLEATLKKICD